MGAQKDEVSQWAAELIRENDLLAQQVTTLQQDVAESHAGARARLADSETQRSAVVDMLKNAFRQELAERKCDHESRVDRLQAEFEAAIVSQEAKHTAVLLAEREAHEVERGAMIKDHRRTIEAKQRSWQLERRSKEEEIEGMKNAHELQHELVAHQCEQLKTELTASNRAVELRQSEKRVLQSDLELAWVKLGAISAQNETMVQDETVKLGSLQTQLLREREQREQERQGLEEVKVRTVQRERDSRHAEQRCHIEEMERLREELCGVRREKEGEVRCFLTKGSQMERERDKAERERDAMAEANALLHEEVERLNQQVRKQEDQLGEAKVDCRKSVMKAHEENNAEKKTILDALSLEPNRLKHGMKLSVTRQIGRIAHRGTQESILSAVASWRHQVFTGAKKRLRIFARALHRLGERGELIDLVQGVFVWHCNWKEHLFGAQAREDVAVHRKVRENSEVEIDVLKNRLKKTEREYQSELRQAITAKELLETTLGQLHGSNVSQQISRVTRDSSKAIESSKEAQGKLAQWKSALHSAYGPGVKITDFAQMKQQLDDAEKRATESETVLAAMKIGPAALQREHEKTVEELKEELSVAKTSYKELVKSIRRNESGQIILTLHEVQARVQKVEISAKEKSLVILAAAMARWAKGTQYRVVAKWRERSLRETDAAVARCRLEKETSILREGIKAREDRCSAQEDAFKMQAKGLEDELQQTERREKLKQRFQTQKENRTPSPGEGGMHQVDPETAVYLSKLEAMLEKARDRIRWMEREHKAGRYGGGTAF